MDITKELFDFLWGCPHREGSGIAAGSAAHAQASTRGKALTASIPHFPFDGRHETV